MKLYTPKQWYSLFDCPCLIVDDQGLIWAADAYYKILSGSPSGKIDFSAGIIYGKGLGYDLLEEPIAYLAEKNGITEVQDAKQGVFSAPILYIKDDKVYTPKEYCSIFDVPRAYIQHEDFRKSTSSGSSYSNEQSAGGGTDIGSWVLKLGGGMLVLYCVVIGVVNAMPIWFSILLGIAMIGGLVYMGWFSKDPNIPKPFRLAFWIVLAWFALVAIIIINSL